MKPPKLLKILTIVLFIVLIVVFVSYRSGYLSAFLASEEVNVPVTTHPAKKQGRDTLPVKGPEYDTLNIYTSYSTKSIPIVPTIIKIPPLKFRFDSSVQEFDTSLLQTSNKKGVLLPGTKSGIIVPVEFLPSDSTISTSSRKKQ